MGWNIFKRFRKDDTVIDLADLQKRGIIKNKERDTVDLTSSSSSGVDSSPLGFLGSLASSSASETPEVSSIVEPDGKTKLKGILRDMKSKLDSAYNRMYKLSDRVDLLEKKLERLERRSGVSS